MMMMCTRILIWMMLERMISELEFLVMFFFLLYNSSFLFHVGTYVYFGCILYSSSTVVFSA
jgi:hypothetical protein